MRVNWHNRPRNVRHCKTCGQELSLIQRYRRQRFCSVQCIRHNPVPLCTCRHCQQSFKPTHNDRKTFCSRDCAFAWRRKQAAMRAAKEAAARVVSRQVACTICGETMEQKNINHKYCGPDCRREQTRRRSAMRYRAAKDINAPVTKECKHCSSVFEVNYYAGNRNYCSRRCARRAAKRAYRANVRKRRLEAEAQWVGGGSSLERNIL